MKVEEATTIMWKALEESVDKIGIAIPMLRVGIDKKDGHFMGDLIADCLSTLVNASTEIGVIAALEELEDN